MPLTPLARNICVAAVAVIGVAGAGATPLALAATATAAVAAAVLLRPAARDPSLTTMDKALINIERLFNYEAPTPGLLTTVFYFAEGALPSEAQALATMKTVATKYRRFRSAAVLAPNFVESYLRTAEVGAMDMSQHVAMERCADREDIERRINQLANTPLLLAGEIPPWHITILSSKSAPTSGVVVMRVNHSIADGLRLVKASKDFLFFEDGSGAELELLARMSKKKSSSSSSGGKVSVCSFLRDFGIALTLDKVAAETSTAVHKSMTLMSKDEPRATFTDRVNFDLIKQIKLRCPTGTTVNDVILTAFCSAVRRYCAARGEPLDSDCLMRALVAFALPDHLSSGAPGDAKIYNDFLLPSFRLPTQAPNRSECLPLVQEAMGGIKRSAVGFIQKKATAMLGALGLDALIRDTQLGIFRRHSFVYSNVPGFEKPVHMFAVGNEVEAVACYYPNMITQVLFISFRGQLTCSIATDTAQVKDPPALVRAFVAEVQEWAAEGAAKGES